MALARLASAPGARAAGTTGNGVTGTVTGNVLQAGHIAGGGPFG